MRCRKCGCELEFSRVVVFSVGYVIFENINILDEGQIKLCKDCAKEYRDLISDWINDGDQER